MFSPQKPYMIGIFDFQSHEKAYSLQGVEPLVYVIAQKHILDSLHLFLVRVAEVVKDVEQILEPAVDRAEYFRRSTGSNERSFLSQDLGHLLAESVDFVLFEGKQSEVFELVGLGRHQDIYHAID